MEKINLLEVATNATKKKSEKMRRDSIAYANMVLDKLVCEAEEGKHYAKVHIPTDYFVQTVAARLQELAECKIEVDGRYIKASWYPWEGKK